MYHYHYLFQKDCYKYNKNIAELKYNTTFALSK